MDIWKEGLKEYKVLEEVTNQYFLDVEYHILRYNRIELLVPVQVRDQDGICRLLYETSGLRSIKTVTEKHILSLQEYRLFIEDCRSLVQAMDEYMLDISQISFVPEDIYQEKDGHFRWMYLPESKGETGEYIVKLFEWLLSVIDYGDIQTVQFAYHAYWSVRNHTFSGELMDKCLNYTGEEIARYPAGSYDAFFAENMEEGSKHTASPSKDIDTARMDRPGTEISREAVRMDQPWTETRREISGMDGPWMEMRPEASLEKKKDCKGILLLAVEIICMVTGILALIGLGFLLVLGFRQGISREMIYLYILLFIAVLLLFDCVWQIHRNRKQQEDDKGKASQEKKKTPAPSYDYVWEETGGTQVLGIRKDMLQPALREQTSGRIYTIEDFPWYIGSEPGRNHLVIPDSAVSRRHAAIIRGKQTGQYDLQDLCSTNGTWLNQKAMIYDKPSRLESGDEIVFAKQKYEFMILDCPMGEYRHSF